MKQLLQKNLVLMMLVFIGSTVSKAHLFTRNGIFYNTTSSSTVEVTFKGEQFSSYQNEYIGSVTIPERVTYNGYAYSVTSIGEYAFRGCSDLKYISIPNSVKNIESLAFDGCNGLTTITVAEGNLNYDSRNNCNAIIESANNRLIVGCKNTVIPNSVTDIFYNAFGGCSGLTSITIPNSVTSIGSSAFHGCSGLTSITIPNSVTSIGSFAFDYCSSLTSITIPNSVTSIGSRAFGGCSNLITITVEEGNLNYDSRNNCNAIIESANNTLIAGCKNTAIPNSVVGIGQSAFCNLSSLASITIPNSVTSIGDYAFEGSSGLMIVTIPNSVISIGSCAFRYCSALKTVINCSSGFSIVKGSEDCGYVGYYAEQVYNVTGYDRTDDMIFVEEQGKYILAIYIGEKMILTLPDFEDKTYSIGINAFRNSSLTSVTIPNSVTSIGDYAFANCSGLTDIVIGNSVTSIGDYAFSGCSSLERVTIPNSVTSIGEYAFRNCSGLECVTIGDSVMSIGERTFEYCSSLADITIGNSVMNIGDYAFHDCTALTNITIPNSVKSIGEGVFWECDGLTSVTIGNNVTSIGKFAFDGCLGLADITIGNSVTNIGNDAFRNCSSLTSIIIPKSVTNIGNYAFYNCSALKTVINCSAEIGIIKGRENHGYIGYYADIVYNVTGYERIDDLIFVEEQGKYILAIYIGEKMILTLPDFEDKTYSIGINAFRNSSLTSVTIPNSVTSIGDYAFVNCSNLTNIIIPNTVTAISNYVFSGCSALESVTIPNSVTSIGMYAFSGCSALESVTIPNSVMSIGYDAFGGCRALEELYIEDGDEALSLCCHHHYANSGQGLFTICPLEILYIGRNLTYQTSSYGGYSPFYHVRTLSSVVIGEKVTEIGSNLFHGCSSLREITIGQSVKTIGDNSLVGCSALESIMLRMTLPPAINEDNFEYQQYLTIKLQVPEGTLAIYQFADVWKKFFNIEEFDPTSIDDITVDAKNDTSGLIYNFQGVEMKDKDNLPAGIYIQSGKKIVIK